MMPDHQESKPSRGVSVLIAAFNVENYITECLESVDNQTAAPDEIIIINDGSTDGTLLRILEWSSRTSIPSKVITQENRGITKTRNRLLKMANYELIAFLDSDDYWVSNHLEKMKAAFCENSNIVCCFSDASAFNDQELTVTSYLNRSNVIELEFKEKNSLRILTERITKELIPGCFIHLNSSIFLRESAVEIGLFDESLPLSEDRDFFIRLSNYGDWAYYPEVHSFIRQHESNSTGSKNKLSVLEKSVMVAKKILASENLLKTHEERKEAKRVLHNSMFNYRYTASKMGLSHYFATGKSHDSLNKLIWLTDFKSWLRASNASLSSMNIGRDR